MTSSPLWRGGGRIFPNSPDENFTQKVNRKMYRAGMASILSQLAREGRLRVVDDVHGRCAQDQAARAEGKAHGPRERAGHHRRARREPVAVRRATCRNVLVIVRRATPIPCRWCATRRCCSPRRAVAKLEEMLRMSASTLQRTESTERLMTGAARAGGVREEHVRRPRRTSQYVFRVLHDATKPEIKAAVELMFKIKVESA